MYSIDIFTSILDLQHCETLQFQFIRKLSGLVGVYVLYTFSAEALCHIIRIEE